MSRLILFNKPFGVLSQFTDGQGRSTLADFITLPGVYPAGRLDRDSEGLLALTDDGALQHRIAHPRFHSAKRYLAQVDGAMDKAALAQLCAGIQLKDGPARALDAELTCEPDWLWPRDPPVRFRKAIPTSWISVSIDEGRNRQVRRMTAAVGHPTLRLIRLTIGKRELGDLKPGEWRRESA